MSKTTLLLAATLPLVISSGALAQPAGLTYPRSGVVCDSVGKTCYDSYGPSIGITSDVYGKKERRPMEWCNSGGSAPA
jgi:hypothetical protein